MHKKIALLLVAFILGISSYMHAGELTAEQQKLKNTVIVALGFNIRLKHNLLVSPYSKDAMQQIEQQALTDIDSLLDKRVELPENVIEELHTFGSAYEELCAIEVMEQNAQVVSPGQLLGFKPQIINP